MSGRITRRTFSAGAAAAGLAAATRVAPAALGANEQVRIAVVGVGNRGDQLLEAFKPHKDMKIVALCDVYKPYLDFAAAKVGGNPVTTGDYRTLLERKDVDAVVIATPDHWHALQFVDACKAGKDVYVEKPLSLVVAEGRAMIKAAAEAKCITQMGVHRRSAPVWTQAAQLIGSGAIGKVTACRCFHIVNESPLGIGNPPDAAPPAGLDWDTWLGPAPKVPYNENRCLYKFRWFRDYSGGQMTNFGTHWLDVIQWCTGQDAPEGVFAVGHHKVVTDNRQVPDTMEAVWSYPDGMLVNFAQYNANGAPGLPNSAYIEFRGTSGTLYVNDSKLEIAPENNRLEPLAVQNPVNRKESYRQSQAVKKALEKSTVINGKTDTVAHARNFLDCVKSRKACNCPVEIGHKSTATTLIANIACDHRKYLAWDAQKECFTNDEQANKQLRYEYRAPWKLEM